MKKILLVVLMFCFLGGMSYGFNEIDGKAFDDHMYQKPHHYQSNYRRHHYKHGGIYKWKKWFREERHNRKYKHGIYHNEGNKLYFSYCDCYENNCFTIEVDNSNAWENK